MERFLTESQVNYLYLFCLVLLIFIFIKKVIAKQPLPPALIFSFILYSAYLIFFIAKNWYAIGFVCFGFLLVYWAEIFTGWRNKKISTQGKNRVWVATGAPAHYIGGLITVVLTIIILGLLALTAINLPFIFR